MDMMYFKKEENIPTPITVGGGEYKNVDVVGKQHGCPFDVGISEYFKGEIAEFDHDNYGDAVYIIEGELVFTENTSDMTIHAKAGDIVYLPQKEGLKIRIGAPEYSKIFWICYPHWQ